MLESLAKAEGIAARLRAVSAPDRYPSHSPFTVRCVTTTRSHGASLVSLSVVAAPATSVMGTMKVSTTKVVIIATEAVRAHRSRQRRWRLDQMMSSGRGATSACSEFRSTACSTWEATVAVRMEGKCTKAVWLIRLAARFRSSASSRPSAAASSSIACRDCRGSGRSTPHRPRLTHACASSRHSTSNRSRFFRLRSSSRSFTWGTITLLTVRPWYSHPNSWVMSPALALPM
mmetsp:Transcript_22097/g.48485  ORF Transcript_22097/g.48485 Transcript_22097/m.48485 type:complete len:231 (+) Transcript_22097:353-1045(+)